MPEAEPVTASGRAGLAAVGVACAAAMAAGSLMEWASLGGLFSIDGTERRGDLTLILAVAAAAAWIVWGAKTLDSPMLPMLAALAFTVGAYVVIDDARDLVDLSRQASDLALQLNPAIEPANVVELGTGVFLTGGAALAGLVVALAALLSSD